MAQKMDDIMDLCCTLAETDLKVAVRSYIKGSVTTGGAAALGAVFLGPVGFFVGKDKCCLLTYPEDTE